MAEIDPEIVRQFEEKLRSAGLTVSQLSSIMSALNAQSGIAASRAGALAKSLAEAQSGSRAQGAAAAQLVAELKRSASAAARGGREATEEYKRAVDSVTANMGTANPQLLRSVKRYADAQLDAAERAETYSRIVSSVSTPIRAMGSGLGQVFSAYQGGASSIGVASKVLEVGLSMAGKTASTVGSVLQGFGGAIQSATAFSGLLGKVLGSLGGGLLNIVGVGFKAVGAAAQGAAQLVPLLGQEVQGLATAFQSLSANGAIFTNGLQNMINAAGNAGVTLGQLDKIVAVNKEYLAQFGEGVAGGMNRLTRIMADGGPKFRKQLFQLGYTVEEQAGLIAETMRDLKQSGGRIPSGPGTNEAILQYTAKYAENLRIISDITGEDAKAKMAQARSAANELAFQQKLATMDATQRKNIVDAMATMSPIMQKAFQQTVVFGNAIEPTTAAFLAQSDSARAALGDTMDAYRSGTLTAQRGMEINANHAEGIQQDMLSNQGIAMAGMAGVGGLVGDLKSVMQDELQFRNKWNRDSIEQAMKAARDQQRPETDVNRPNQNVIQDRLADVMGAGQDLNVQIQKSLYQSGVLEATMKGMAWAADEFKTVLISVTDHLRKLMPASYQTTGQMGFRPNENSDASREAARQQEEQRSREEIRRLEEGIRQRNQNQQPQETPRQNNNGAPTVQPQTFQPPSPAGQNGAQVTPASFAPNTNGGAQFTPASFTVNGPEGLFTRASVAVPQNQIGPENLPDSNKTELKEKLTKRLESLTADQSKDLLSTLASSTREQKQEFLKAFSDGNKDIETSIIEQLQAKAETLKSDQTGSLVASLANSSREQQQQIGATLNDSNTDLVTNFTTASKNLQQEIGTKLTEGNKESQNIITKQLERKVESSTLNQNKDLLANLASSTRDQRQDLLKAFSGDNFKDIEPTITEQLTSRLNTLTSDQSKDLLSQLANSSREQRQEFLTAFSNGNTDVEASVIEQLEKIASGGNLTQDVKKFADSTKQKQDSLADSLTIDPTKNIKPNLSEQLMKRLDTLTADQSKDLISKLAKSSSEQQQEFLSAFSDGNKDIELGVLEKLEKIANSGKLTEGIGRVTDSVVKSADDNKTKMTDMEKEIRAKIASQKQKRISEEDIFGDKLVTKDIGRNDVSEKVPSANTIRSKLVDRLGTLNADQRKAMLNKLISSTKDQQKDFLSFFSGDNLEIAKNVIEQLSDGKIPDELSGLLKGLEKNKTSTKDNKKTKSATEDIDPYLNMARLYHEGPKLPSAEELAKQKQEEEQKRAEADLKDDQEREAAIKQNAANKAIKKPTANTMGEDSTSILEKIYKSMSMVEYNSNESFTLLKDIASNTKQTAIHVA